MRSSRIAALAAAVLSLPVFAAGMPGFEACSQNFFQGFAPKPTTAQPGKLRALCFDSFAVLHSGQSKTPVYSAEHLTPDRMAAAHGEKRTDRFYEEARLPSAERAQLADYAQRTDTRKSLFDRGHMSPAGDMPNPNAMAQSFSLANMVPQAPSNNRGVWAKTVEKTTRKYVERGNEVYVLTGPIYKGQPETIGSGKVWVPSALFKLVYDPAKKKAWAYIVDNNDSAKVDRVYSYADLVRLTGMDYLPAGAVKN